ncbi:MAG: hypothetical protein F4133_13690 [Gammaproteobacteria bacterium]|nr:hypothetical protein [Gammaproteobacteria bacterium]
MKLLATIVSLLALGLAGCTTGTSITLHEDGTVSMQGSMNDKENLLFLAMRQVYLECGGDPNEKNFRANWRPDNPFPVWEEGKGWHYKDFECVGVEPERETEDERASNP